MARKTVKRRRTTKQGRVAQAVAAVRRTRRLPNRGVRSQVKAAARKLFA